MREVLVLFYTLNSLPLTFSGYLQSAT